MVMQWWLTLSQLRPAVIQTISSFQVLIHSYYCMKVFFRTFPGRTPGMEKQTIWAIVILLFFFVGGYSSPYWSQLSLTVSFIEMKGKKSWTIDRNQGKVMCVSRHVKKSSPRGSRSGMSMGQEIRTLDYRFGSVIRHVTSGNPLPSQGLTFLIGNMRNLS